MSNLNQVENFNLDFVDCSKIEGVQVDLIYTRPDNFTNEAIYGDLRIAYLHRHAAEKLRNAYSILKKAKPDWKFLVTDALRPKSVHQKMWDAVKGTTNEMYVANPLRGSIHSFGLAVDLTLIDQSSNLVDMGTPVDSFEELAQPRYESRFLQEGKLSQVQVANRLLLRDSMTSAGFLTIPHEWWHFNATTLEEAKSKYKPIL